MITKKTIGSVFFSYVEQYPSEVEALNGQNGQFISVNLDKLRIERVKVIKQQKENDDNKSEDSTKTEGQRTEEV